MDWKPPDGRRDQRGKPRRGRGRPCARALGVRTAAGVRATGEPSPERCALPASCRSKFGDEASFDRRGGELIARKTRTQLRQVYDITGGQIEVKITSEDTLSAETLKDFGAVVTACDEFACARPPAPGEVRSLPRAVARGEEGA